MVCICGCKKDSKTTAPQKSEVTTSIQTNDKLPNENNKGYFKGYSYKDLVTLAGKKFEETVLALRPVVMSDYPVESGKEITNNNKTYYMVKPDFAKSRSELERYMCRYVTQQVADSYLAKISPATLSEIRGRLYVNIPDNQEGTEMEKYQVTEVTDLSSNSVSFKVAYIFKSELSKKDDFVEEHSFTLTVEGNTVRVSEFFYPLSEKAT